MIGISLAGNSIQNSLPGGLVFYAAYVFRQYRRFGADDVLAGWTLVAANGLSFIALSALAAVGLGLALGAGSALDLVETILGIVVLAGLLALAWVERARILPRTRGSCACHSGGSDTHRLRCRPTRSSTAGWDGWGRSAHPRRTGPGRPPWA